MGMSAGPDRLPVIAGVAQHDRRPDDPLGQPDPCAMIASALRAAAKDSGAGEPLLGRVQSLRVPRVLCWSYGDPGAQVAERLGLGPAETVSAHIGGDTPQLLVNDAAEAIARGELDVAAIAGAEALHTVSLARREGVELDWPADDGRRPTRTLGPDRPPTTPAEQSVGLFAPVSVYPLIENALRHRAGRTVEAHQRWLGELWSRFSGAAGENPHAWSRTVHSGSEIADASAQNRAVSFPYTKLMNANPLVDQAAALIVCSLQAAQEAGVPAERCVFLHAGAEASDEWFLSQRGELDASPAIRAAGRALLEAGGRDIDEVAHLDLYSCFPSAVQVAARELGLGSEPDRALTVTGGLAFAGGPGNNYVTHAIARMVQILRQQPGTLGLTTGVGWYMTKHALGLMSGEPPRDGYRRADLGEVRDRPPRSAVVGEPARGTAEACTLLFERDGSASYGVATLLRDDGARALAKVSDPDSIALLIDEAFLGARARVDCPPGADAVLLAD